MRRRNQNATGQRPKRGAGRIFLYIFSVFFVIGLIGLGVVYKYVSDILSETPPIEEYDINVLLSENSYIYDSDGNLIEKVEDTGLRTIVPYEKIDEDIRKAIVAVEDKTFWEHHGFNYVRLIGAVVESVSSGKEPKGTSTITQQYARNMYLPETRFSSGAAGYKRKVQEAYYAVNLEKNLTKEEILSAYLNTIEFGTNTKGIQAATTRYFSKDADDIDYIEAAILAGIPQANTSYSPFKILRTQDIKADDYVLGEDSDDRTIVFNETCLDRYKVVLSVMHNNGVISDEEYEFAKNYDIRQKLKPTPLKTSELSSYFTDMVKKEVIQKFIEEKGMSEEDARNQLYRGGLRIYSTMDSNLQRKIDAAFDGEPFNSVYDKSTVNAVMDFQKRYGLNADGVAGPGTVEKMVEKGLFRGDEVSSVSFAIGMDSPEVLILKKALEKNGLLYRKHIDMPSLYAYRDANKNILGVEKNQHDAIVGSTQMLNYYDNIINPEGQLVISPDNYYVDENGDIVFKKNKMFNFYSVLNPGSEEREIELFIKNAYKCHEASVVPIAGGGRYYYQKVSIPQLYIYNGSTVRIPKEYKRENSQGEFVLSSAFFNDNPEVILKGEDGTLYVNPEHYGIASQGIIQPQASMTVIDYKTGEMRAVAGGRNVEGQMIYNRATNPRQPGSAIKPLGVYLPCFDNGYSPASIVEDTPTYSETGDLWPKNWYKFYYGSITLRKAVEQSSNVPPVKLLRAIGVEKGYEYLEKLGISTLVKEGPVNDMNVSALALGGMTHGTTNFDMTGAYGAIANGGTRKETITFTKITDKNGTVVFENIPKETYVASEQAAWLMQDVLYSTASHGFMNGMAAIRPGNVGIPMVGKTGTTSSKFDIWYCGYTPYYASSIWIGSDINLGLSQESSAAAKYWQKINKIIHENYPNKNFKNGADLGLIRVSVDGKSGLLPSSLSHKDPSGNGVITDWFIPGNQPKKVDDNRFSVAICQTSGKIATPGCPSQDRTQRIYRKRIEPVPSKAAGIAIKDQDEIAPADILAMIESLGEITEEIQGPDNLNYAELAKKGDANPYCFVHTGEDRSDDLTSEILSGVKTLTKSGGGKIITQSIIITRQYGEDIKVNAGSEIYESGAIVNQDGETIYPWQIKSFSFDKDGPSYVPQEESGTQSDGNSDWFNEGTDEVPDELINSKDGSENIGDELFEEN